MVFCNGINRATLRQITAYAGPSFSAIGCFYQIWFEIAISVVVKYHIGRIFIMLRANDLWYVTHSGYTRNVVYFGPSFATIGGYLYQTIVCTYIQNIFIQGAFRYKGRLAVDRRTGIFLYGIHAPNLIHIR